MAITTHGGTTDAADKLMAQAPLPAWSGSARTGTDLDLAPIMRTEANYWKAQFFQASRELTKANKGIRRLRSGRDREMSRLRTAIYRYHGNDCLCQDCTWVKAQNDQAKPQPPTTQK